MEGFNYIAFAIPAVFIFIFLEYAITVTEKRKTNFKFAGSVSNINIGIAERTINLFLAGGFYGFFVYIYNNYALFAIPNDWYMWILLLLGADFLWYWYHRLGHEINFFWAAHIVHHQSEEFNLTTSARITTFQALIRYCFWGVLPLVGFSPDMVITALLVHGGYSFFTHTKLFNKLGWAEYVFITPSLHGVHHASNEKYLDKNYGDMFVFWDKLFGTFQKEEEEPSYGLTHPLNSHSFLWQHFHYYFEIAEACKRAPGLTGKLRIIFGSPAVMDQDIRPSLEKIYLPEKSADKGKLKKAFKLYLIVQTILASGLLIIFTLYFNFLNLPLQLGITAFILLTLISCGAMLEQRKWVYYLEYAKILVPVLYIGYSSQSVVLVIGISLALYFTATIFSLREQYVQTFFSNQ